MVTETKLLFETEISLVVALCQSILKWPYTGLSLCIAILVYLGTGLGTSLFLGRGHSLLPRPHSHYVLYSALCCSIRNVYMWATQALCIDTSN